MCVLADCGSVKLQTAADGEVRVNVLSVLVTTETTRETGNARGHKHVHPLRVRPCVPAVAVHPPARQGDGPV